MNKIIYLVLFFLHVFFFSNAQHKEKQIKYELYLLDSCEKKVTKLKFYVLVKNDSTYAPNEEGVLFLNEKGTYGVSTIHYDELRDVTLNTFEHIIDTVTTENIRQCTLENEKILFSGYCCCDEYCDGEQTSYYANGNVHITGTFKDGVPIGKVKRYYPNGDIQQIDFYNKKGEFRKRKQYPVKSKKKRMK